MDRYQELVQKKEKIRQMGGPKAVEQQHKSGKWTARERIEYFFDPGTFTEMGMFVRHRTTAFGMDKRDVPAEGVVVGYGKVNGRKVMVAAEDYTTMAGTFGEYHGKKFAQAIDMAREMGIPFIGMNDSGGARLQEGMDTLQAYAWLFRSQILASGIIPQLALLMGPCLGGQAYHPVMQDFVFQCKKTGFMGIAGPAFVKTQLGEEISLEDLCGVRVHATKTGQTHVVAEDDRDCLDKARELLSYLPQNNREMPPRVDTGDEAERIVPELDHLVPEEASLPFDMHEVIKRVVDNGIFFEILKDFAQNVIVGFGRISGRTVGLVASQPLVMGGVINCDAADKVARFVRFCDLFNIPLVNFHDTPGYMIGSYEEHRGILRHGAKMLYAYIDATVPKVTVILRKSFAGAYLGMCCKDTGADIVYAWPIAQVSIVGAETAASVIFAKEIKNADDPSRVMAERIQQYRTMYENPYCGAERGYIDDVIMPADTRKYIARALDILENKQVARPYRKYSNINL
ncbi:acyl-CoA carboxylase subunit beta [Desulfofundulus thermobenzoicus]|uniref:Acyl-CoA carboxylase subunit beta n=1 Tax=Desulfofundulus thermobenzoicus TaxID=29376 RepID=A0A6N7IP84_9FIRM|nr:carboxyl transferase domain-containing protein [Desulfofundulus thermobenzoicus]MQL51760.1 acyl-CoA carboxylase subunit beta [Desulfofundulus thermobenzoicus]